MILAFRVGDIEATFDSDGEFVTPEAAQDYLKRAAEVARAIWKSLPDVPAPVDAEADVPDTET